MGIITDTAIAVIEPKPCGIKLTETGEPQKLNRINSRQFTETRARRTHPSLVRVQLSVGTAQYGHNLVGNNLDQRNRKSSEQGLNLQLPALELDSKEVDLIVHID